MNELQIKEIINKFIFEIAAERNLTFDSLYDKHLLVDELGFASLEVARLIALLEENLKVDPFLQGNISITEVRTVGDLYRIYTTAC